MFGWFKRKPKRKEPIEQLIENCGFGRRRYVGDMVYAASFQPLQGKNESDGEYLKRIHDSICYADDADDGREKTAYEIAREYTANAVSNSSVS